MQVILVAIGSAGDVYPFIGLGKALVEQGHAVTLCSMPPFQAAIEQNGLEFVPVCDALTYRQAMDDPRLWEPKTSFGTLWQVIAGMLEPVYRYVVSRRFEDIVVVGSLWALGARIAHERYGIPYLSVQVSPSTLLSAHVPPVHPKFNVSPRVPLPLRKWLWRGIEYLSLDRTCAPAIDALRHKIGLTGKVQNVFSQWLHAPQGVLCLFPSWFAAGQPDWPRPLSMVGFPLFDGSQGGELDPQVQAFLADGSAPIVFTQGSTTHFDPGFYRLAISALAKLGARGIFLSGDREALGDLPANVLQCRYAPMSVLLPHCAALVHPAGVGAMSLALAAGIPQVVMPVAHDQFDNAERLVRLGAGVRLQLPLGEHDLLEALVQVRSHPAVRQACLLAHQRSVANDACAQAVELIEDCHARHGSGTLSRAV
ncbi:glycosyltransferase [Pseudomonas putida]